LVQITPPWEVMVAELNAGGEVQAFTAVQSGKPVDRIVQNPSGIALKWAGNTHVFMSYRDGFPHLYSIERPAPGKQAKLLTPGSFMVEHTAISPDGTFVVYTANTGANRDDNDRRHLFKV